MNEDQELCCCCRYRRLSSNLLINILCIIIASWIYIYIGKTLIDYGAGKIAIVKVN